MLSWGAPGALWLGLILLPILFFYFLRLRYRRQPVSSVYLWVRLQQVTRGGSHLRWKSLFLLLLQVAIAAAVVLAAARPDQVRRRLDQPGVLFLLDVSASMGTIEDGHVSRLDQAKVRLAREIRQLPAKTEGMVFLCAAGAVPLGGPTDDHRQLAARLGPVRPSGAAFAETAVAEALQAWLALQGRPWQARLITDGGLDLYGRRLADLFGGLLSTDLIGARCGDLGVTGLRLAEEGRISFSLVNGWPGSRRVRIRVERDGRTIARALLTAPPGTSGQSLTAGGDAGGPGAYTAVLEQPPDALPLDDRAYLAVNRPCRLRILLAGADSPFLQAALGLPGVELTRVDRIPARGFTGQEWDLVVADGVAVPAGITCNLLTFGRVPTDAPVRLAGDLAGPLLAVATPHPLQRYTDWEGIRIGAGKALAAKSPGVQVLATVNGQPALVAWEGGGRRGVAWGATLFGMDLGLSAAFPIFLRNLLQWCVPQMDNPLAYTLVAGEPRLLACTPAWRNLGREAIESVRSGRLVTVQASAPGVFRWAQGAEHGLLAANLPASELDLAPHPLLVGRDDAKLGARYTYRRFPLAQILLVFALACLALEWFAWWGGWRAGKG